MQDEVCGDLQSWEKEQLQADMEEQMELGFDGLVTMGRSLATVALEDLESSNGDQQPTGILAASSKGGKGGGDFS